ncbi:MAG: hypothetical protein JXR76_16265 [Deltaproteobacteria bacterium]|nr:hypothetical protein [Deltaproteobacteria bacterium]
MKNPTVPVFLVLMLSLVCFRAQAACGNDMDCKGDRICVEGNCVFPPQQKKKPDAETPPPPPAPDTTGNVTAPAESPAASAPTDDVPPASTGEPPQQETPPAPPMAPVETPVDPAPAQPPVAQDPVPPPPPPADAAAPQPAPAAASAPSTSPPPASQPVASPPAVTVAAVETSAPVQKKGVSHFEHGYGDVGMVIGFGTAGRMFMVAEGESDSDSLRGSPTPGIRIAGYGVSGGAHHGAYFAARFGDLEFQDETDDIRMISFGYSNKQMKPAKGRRVKTGFAFDIGMVFTQNQDMADSSIDFENDTFIGMELFPRFQLDIVVLNTGAFKLVVPVSIGMYLLPINAMRILEDPVTVTALFMALQPALTIGVDFGG